MAKRDGHNGEPVVYSRGYTIQLVCLTPEGKREYRTVSERRFLDKARLELGYVAGQVRDKFTRGRLLVLNDLHRGTPVEAVRLCSNSEPDEYNPLDQINF